MPAISSGPEWNFTGAQDPGAGHDAFLIEHSAGAGIVIGDWMNSPTHATTVAGLGSEWAFH